MTITVPHRRIGRSGPEVSVLSLGSWHTYDRMTARDAVELLRTAVDVGINLFDVGFYGSFADGTNVPQSFTDVLFGRYIQSAGVARDEYVLSIKLWLEDYPEHTLSDQIDNALLRIGTDHADFAILGDIDDPGPDPRRLVTDLGTLVADGRLGGWGVNNWSCDAIRAVHDAAAAEGVPGPQLAQLKYSVVRRSIADGEPFRALTADTGITLEASDVFEGGILAGHAKPNRVIGKDPGGIRANIADAADKLAQIARSMNATPAQLAIAFCLTHPTITSVLFGASRLSQLNENLGALDLLARHGDDVSAIRDAVDGLWLDRNVVDPSGRR
jgi:aryl-alcohol dehydrogenase-like predicted oxidoreductase